MEVQFIEKQGVAEWAVMPVKTYRRLVEDSEMLQDILDYDQAKRLVENGQELIPSQVTFAILDGENPIKVWRNNFAVAEGRRSATLGLGAVSSLSSRKDALVLGDDFEHDFVCAAANHSSTALKLHKVLHAQTKQDRNHPERLA